MPLRMRNGGRGASRRGCAECFAGKKKTMELEDGEEVLGGGERVISVSSSDSGSEGDEVAALPADTTSPRGNKASTPRKSSTPGERRRRTIYIAGRPPWYDSHGQIAEAFVIGLAGGSASGKTTVARRIIESLGVPWVSLLSMDSFYKVLTPEQNQKAAENEYNFDRPEAFDMDLLVDTLQKLKEGKHVEIPIYDFSTHAHAKYKHTMYGANVVVFEGIMAFCHAPLLKLMDLKIFVDTDSDIRLARRLHRDIAERGRDLEGVLKQYSKFVKPAFHQFIQPTMQYADIVVPRGGQNRVAVQLIVEHVKDQLKQRGFNNRPKLLAGQRETEALPDSVHILPNKPQVKAMHTVIRNKETKRDEFVFFTNRLACLAMEYAHSFLPFQDVVVITPQGDEYSGKRFNGELCGVSIMRAGEVLEPALLSVCKEATIGKILIQTNETTDEPALHFLRLPSHISQCHVILMDATIATGAAAIMAIRILLDHDVPQENIIFVTMLAARLGIQTLAYSFPRVRIVTTAVDPKVSRDYHILPGVGNYGDRYFGTEPD